MADGFIKIDIEVDGKQVIAVTKALDELEDSGRKSGKGVKGAEDAVKGVGNESEKASGGVKKFVTALGLVAIGAMAFKTLKGSLDDAIKRFDTLNQFPKVLQALGVSAEDSEKAMTRLSDGIDGLPTKLDDITATAQRMYTSFNDMDKATDSALALNNALLGSGSSAEQAGRGTEQYLKALQTGHFDLITWRSLSETMDVGLVKIAEGFGYAGASAKDNLYNALKDGTITLDQFNDKLIEVGTGTGTMAELAKENSLGIATSLGNLRYAVARGVTIMLESFNELSKSVTGKDIAENLDGMKNIVMAVFRAIGRVIEGATPIVKGFATVIKGTIPIVEALSPAIIGLMAAYAAHTVIMKAQAAISAANAIIKIAMASTNALTLATAASATASGADTVAKAAQSGAIGLSTLAIGVMTGTIKVSTAAQVIATTVTYAFGAAIKFLMGPIGWVVGGIGLLVAGVIAVVKWFKRSSEEAKRLNKETEELGDSTDALASSTNDSAEAYKKNQTEIKASSKANADLAKKVDELSKKENKSAAEKAMLTSYVDQLNESVEGLNLSYSEEADALSMSSGELQARVDLMKEQELAAEGQARLLEISKEQNEVDMKLEETNALREEWNQKLDDGSVKSREHKKALEELDEQEQVLKETTAELGEQQVIAEEQFTTAMENITAATDAAVSNHIISFEELSESQQATIESMKAKWEEYKDAATDMFETLSDEAELTIGEMTSNLEENQRIIGEWADNIATLAERGVDEGLLNTLRDAGPESAGHVNALVNASDDELKKLSDAFAKGGDVATEALSKSLDIKESGVLDSVKHLVVDTEDSLKQQIKDANFKGIGQDVADGLAGGIKDGSKEATDASKQMAEDTIDAAKDALDTHSPSREFREIGKSAPEGMELGINDGTSSVIQAMQKLSKSSIDQFNNTPAQFKSIGVNSMLGLNQGLLSGRSRVLSTARSIANSIASTMQSALRIHSPSRVMEDDVGAETVAGVRVGIEKNAGSVYRALDLMSQKMIAYSTPEMALGTGSMARNAMHVGGAGNISRTENKYNTVNMDGLFNGATFNVRDDNDIPKLAKQLNDYIKMGARKNGVIMP